MVFERGVSGHRQSVQEVSVQQPVQPKRRATPSELKNLLPGALFRGEEESEPEIVPLSKPQVLSRSSRNWLLLFRERQQNIRRLDRQRRRIDPTGQYVMQEEGSVSSGPIRGWSKGQILTGAQLQDIYGQTQGEYGRGSLFSLRQEGLFIKQIQSTPDDSLFYMGDNAFSVVSIVSPEQREQMIQLEMRSHAEKKLMTPSTYKFSVPFVGTWDTGVRQPGSLSQFNLSTLSVYDRRKAERSVNLRLKTGGEVWGSFAPRTRFTQSYAQAGLSAVLWPVTLPQLGVKLLTGKTHFLPDISQEISKRMIPGQPLGLISSTFEEGVGRITGQRTDAYERFLEDPWSGAAATFGEIAGFQIGGAALHVAKVGTIKGLGHVRSGLTTLTGWSLPGYTTLTYHLPTRMLRRFVVRKIGGTEIGSAMGLSFHAPDVLTERGLSYAKGGTTGARISWTVEQTEKTLELPYSQGEYLITSASSQRLGFSFTVKGKVLHELPSMSFTPYGFAPTRFYRFEASGLSYSSTPTLLPKLFSPTGIVTRLENLYEAPLGSFEDISRWALRQPKGSWGTIGPKMRIGGPETEINVFGSRALDVFNRQVLKRYLPEPAKASIMQRVFGYQFYANVPLEGGLLEVVPVKFTFLKGTGLPSGLKRILSAKSQPMPGVVSVSGLSPSASLSRIFSFVSGPSKNIGSVSSSMSSPFYASYPSMPSSRILSSFSSMSPSSFSVPSYPSFSSPSLSSPSSLISPSRLSIPSYPSLPSYPSVPRIPSYAPPSYPVVFSSIFGFPRGKKKPRYRGKKGARHRVHPVELYDLLSVKVAI